MKDLYCQILIIGSGIFSLVTFIIISIASLVGCRTPPIIDLFHPNYKNLTTPCIIIKSVHWGDNIIDEPWDFLRQNNGWATNHYITNFIITFFVSSLILYSKKNDRKLGLRYYLYVIAFTVMKGVIGEIIESCIGVGSSSILKILKDSGSQKFWLFDILEWIILYWRESVGDIILSDMVQSFLASLLAVMYMYMGIIKPISILLLHKKWYILTIRTMLFSLFLLSTFIIVAKKKYFEYEIPVGYIAYMFLQWFLLTILWIEDRICSKKTNRLSKKDVDWFYIFLGIFMFSMWCSMAWLTAPGLITSNIVSVGLFFVILVLYITIYYPNFKNIKIKF